MRFVSESVRYLSDSRICSWYMRETSPPSSAVAPAPSSSARREKPAARSYSSRSPPPLCMAQARIGTTTRRSTKAKAKPKKG